MILEGYGIRLIRLKAEDLELLREKRNSDDVRQFMQFRDVITPEMQRAWFSGIDNEFNNYFIIEYNGNKCGLISGAEIDWKAMTTGNGGLFIWDTSLWGTHIPLCAAILLTEFSFSFGFKKTYVRVLPENNRAVEFNAQLGYTRSSIRREDQLEVFELTREQFGQKTEKIRHLLKRQHPGLPACIIDDPDHPSSRKIISAYQQLPEAERKQFQFSILP